MTWVKSGTENGCSKISAVVLKAEKIITRIGIEHDEEFAISRICAQKRDIENGLRGVEPWLKTWISRRRKPQGQHGRETTTMNENIRVAERDPCPKFWMLALWFPKAVR